MPLTHVTSDEFSRYIQEEANFRLRLEQRLARDHDVVRSELSEIKALVKEANGRVGKTEQSIAIIQREVEAVKAEDRDIQTTVHDISDHGCRKYASHVAILEAGGDPGMATGEGFLPAHWSRRQKLAAGAAGAVVAWPAIQEIAQALRAVVLWLEHR